MSAASNSRERQRQADPAAMIAITGDAIAEALNDLRNLAPDMIRNARRQKFLDIGRKL